MPPLPSQPLTTEIKAYLKAWRVACDIYTGGHLDFFHFDIHVEAESGEGDWSTLHPLVFALFAPQSPQSEERFGLWLGDAHRHWL